MILSSIIEIGSKLIDKIFPDKTQAEAAKLKLLELQQAGDFKELETELERERIAMQDRVSARTRESAMAEAGKRDIVPPILAILLATGFFSLLVLLIFVDVDSESLTILEIMIGFLGGAFTSVISYYFGSSSSSRQKDTTIANLKNK